jgi:hypothetical protein
MRAAANWLLALPQLGQDVFVRPLAPRQREGGYVALMEACLVVLRGRGGGRRRRPLTGWWFRISGAFLPEAPYRALKARAAVASTLLPAVSTRRIGKFGDAELVIDHEHDCHC